MDVVELGAGIGVLSALIDDALSAGTTHLCVEPDPRTLPLLEETRRLNRCDFVVVGRGCSATPGSATLSLHPDFWRSSTETLHPDRSVAVESTTVRELVDRFDLRRFQLIADIEGSERHLLSNELDLLGNRCTLLIVEFHDTLEQPIEDYDRRLTDAGFDRIDQIDSVHVYRNTRVRR